MAGLDGSSSRSFNSSYRARYLSKAGTVGAASPYWTCATSSVVAHDPISGAASDRSASRSSSSAAPLPPVNQNSRRDACVGNGINDSIEQLAIFLVQVLWCDHVPGLVLICDVRDSR